MDRLKAARQVDLLARLIATELHRVRELLAAHYRHDWGNDPFA